MLKRFNTIILLTVALNMLCAGEVEYGGYWKNFFIYNKYPDLYNMPTDDIAKYNQTGRINLSYIPVDDLSINMSYNMTFNIDQPLSTPFSGMIQRNKNPYRVSDIDRHLFESDDSLSNFAIYQNLDRAYIRYSSFADFYIGRQAIAWGAARMINPSDVIAPYSFDALDTEERIGVDGLRVRIPIGLMHEVDCGYIAGRDFEADSSAFFLRPKFYLFETDFSLTFLKFNKNDYLYSLDFMGSIWDAGLWFEAAYSQLEDDRPDYEDEEVFRMSVGSDYSMLDGELYLAAEYHFSDAGEAEASDYIDNYFKPSFVKGGISFMAQHYFIPSASYQFTPLVTGSANVFCNINDFSAVISPMFEYNIAQDVYLSAGAYIGIGEEGTFDDPKTEFGNYPDMVFSTFRYYF